MRRIKADSDKIMASGPAVWEIERHGGREIKYAWTAEAVFDGVEVRLHGGNRPNTTFAAVISLEYPVALGELMRAAGGVIGRSPFVSRFAENLATWKNGQLKRLGYTDVTWNAAELEVHAWGSAAQLPAIIDLVARTAAEVKRSFEDLCKHVVSSESVEAVRNEAKFSQVGAADYDL